MESLNKELSVKQVLRVLYLKILSGRSLLLKCGYDGNLLLLPTFSFYGSTCQQEQEDVWLQPMVEIIICMLQFVYEGKVSS